MNNEVSAVILCGGKSTRMGFDKSSLCIDGVPLIKIIYENLNTLFDDVKLIGHKNSIYTDYEYYFIEDIYKNCGPIGGIYTGLSHSLHQNVFVFACDMPFVCKSYINYMKNIVNTYNPIALFR